MAKVELLAADDLRVLTSVLFDALPDKQRLCDMIQSDGASAYTAWSGSKLVGAVSMRWSPISEIELLAVASKFRGKGFGRAIVNEVMEEAKRRSSESVIVGTGNIAVDNIIFYQKCGFRMRAVRQDFFHDLRTPIMSRGILLRDMLVFEYKITD